MLFVRYTTDKRKKTVYGETIIMEQTKINKKIIAISILALIIAVANISTATNQVHAPKLNVSDSGDLFGTSRSANVEYTNDQNFRRLVINYEGDSNTDGINPSFDLYFDIRTRGASHYLYSQFDSQPNIYFKSFVNTADFIIYPGDTYTFETTSSSGNAYVLQWYEYDIDIIQ